MDAGIDRSKPVALAMLSSHRPRNLGWSKAGSLLFGDWGTSRLYVLGIAFGLAGGTSLYLIAAMSVLVLLVGWAYTQICRIYPEGGGVYSAARHTSKILAVFGALLLFADYVVTASLSSLDAFHYFGLPAKTHVVRVDPGNGQGSLTVAPSLAGKIEFDEKTGEIRSLAGKIESADEKALLEGSRGSYREAAKKLIRRSRGEELLALDSPGLWAIVATIVIGLFNLMGPKHTGAFALAAAGAMMLITLIIAAFAIPKIDWALAWHNAMAFSSNLPGATEGSSVAGQFGHYGRVLWMNFVGIILALSGVEAIGNLTGVMKKPVAKTARKAIWVVALEVALFNLLLAFAMVSALTPEQREAHQADMLAFLAGHYAGHWAEVVVRIVGGLLLLSAVNTVITDMISVQYLLSRDNELPGPFQSLNKFGVPWIPAFLSLVVPCLVLLVSHDLDSLADLYAMGVVGAVTINISLVTFHPRLRAPWRKMTAGFIALLLMAIWVTLGFDKVHALEFVTIVVVVGFVARAITKAVQKRNPKLPLIRQAILEQLTPEALAAPKILVGTYGSDKLAAPAIRMARMQGATLVVCFVREVSLSYKYDQPLTLDTDPVAIRVFARYLELAHSEGVKVLPVYDSSSDAAVAMAESAAMNGCQTILIGTSRQNSLVHLVKGHFQRRLEAMLPEEIKVEVVRNELTEEPQALLGRVASHA